MLACRLHRICVSLAMAFGVSLPSQVDAQQIDTSALVDAINQGAKEYNNLLPLLTADDLKTRLSAFTVLVGHGDKSLFELAVSTAVADTSEVLRARALWETMARRDNIAVEFDMAEIAKDDSLKSVFETAKNPEQLVWITYGHVADRQCLNLNSSSSAKGQCGGAYSIDVTGLVVTVVYNTTVGQFLLEEDGVLRGKLTYGGVSFPATMTVR
jgi:hypothetical protein